MRALILAAVVAAPVGTWHDPHTGLAVTYATGFHVTTEPQAAITDPVQRFALYTGALPPQVGPPREDQVVAVVMEQEPPLPVDLSRFPLRPHHFHLPRLGAIENFDGDRWGEIVFRDHRRGFYVFVWVGRSETSRVPNLLAALDSIRVGPA
jgi:hypothetical protein